MKKSTVNIIRHYLLFIPLLFYSSGNVFSQTSETDSLLHVLKNSNRDTARVKILIELSQYEQDYFEQIKYAKEAIALSRELNYYKGLRRAHYEIAQKFFILRDSAAAIENFSMAVKIAEMSGDMNAVAFLLQGMAQICFGLENDSLGYACMNKALIIYDSLGNKSVMASIYASTAFWLMTRNRLDEALEKINNVLKIAGELKGGDSMRFLSVSYRSIGENYYKRAFIEAAKDNRETYVQYLNEALFRYYNGLKYSEYAGWKGAIMDACINIGKILVLLHSFSKAGTYLERGLSISEEMGLLNSSAEGYLWMSRKDSSIGNFRNALAYYRKHLDYLNRYMDKDNIDKARVNNLRYEFLQKEDSLKQKNILTELRLGEQKKQRYFYWVGLALLAALSFFVFRNFRNQKKINRLAGEAHAKQKAELELQSLRAQLNPHFMFNSLNAIQELILLEENEKSQSYLARFAKLLRMLLENADKPFIPLQREIDFLHLYLSLENLRIPDLQHSITVDPAIDTEQIIIPNMILQPYIENAIWHGLSHKKEDRKVQLRITKTSSFIQYEIEDNGVGRKKATELKSLYRKEHKSKGMELLSKRFKLLAKEYGADIATTVTDIMTSDEARGTLVVIKVPMKLSSELKNNIS